MAQIPSQEWATIQDGIDTCSECLRNELFKPYLELPIRPGTPIETGRVLFLSEAPPLTGGFWGLAHPDRLRANLLGFLGIETSPFRHALNSFLKNNFFLLQSVKWPLIKTFNHLSARQQRGLIEHSAKEHLGSEIETIRPKKILALGKAEWLSCRFLSNAWKNADIGKFEKDLGVFHPMTVMGEKVKWMATYLIIDQNLRLPRRAEAISLHLQSFLEEEV
ncbi:MAG: hypothetical protein KC643_24490 [Nitrospira sp.]|nr:hypothetical protein [Nitrospira sp.]